SALTVRSIAALLLSILITLYLSRIEKEIPGEGRGALDIVLAFFGGYSKAQALQTHLNEWEDRYRMVVENASEMILLLDRNGQIVDANLAACRIMRLNDRNEVIGKYFPSIFFDNRGEPLLWNEKYLAFGSDRKLNDDFDCFINAADGSRIELSVTLSEIDFENMRMLIVLGRDVTEQNRLAREKEDLFVQLAHAQRLESIGHLAGGVAHDFNNYLHSIIGHLDVIKYIYKIQDQSVMKHVDKVVEISEQAAKLTQQLLGFARKGKYVERELDMGELIRRSVELFVPRGQEDVDVRIEPPPPGVMLKGDLVQLQQVLLNLLLNARDATAAMERDSVIVIRAVPPEQAGVKLTPPPELKNNFSPRQFYCIAVSDNGEGIDPDVAERIFEPFFTTKAMGKGTGMGLSMVYGTIVNHGGWVQFTTQPGMGTTFYLFLPVGAPVATA
ncbi:MAG: ATP-binding protein, partial [Victivallales bacterium]|nr:ATP-binding protein [Victivallales bacterium]